MWYLLTRRIFELTFQIVSTEDEERKEKTQETDTEILAPKTQEKPPEATEAMEPEVPEVQGSIPEEVVEVPKVSEVTVVPTEEDMTVESSNIQSDLWKNLNSWSNI